MPRRPASWLLSWLCLGACSFDGSGQGEQAAGGPSADGSSSSGGGASGGSGGAESSTGGPGVTTGGVGVSGSTGALEATTGGSESTGPASTLPPVTTGATTTGDEATGDPGTTTTEPMTTDGTTTGAPAVCPGPIVQVYALVEDAEVEFPMVEEMSSMGEGQIASSGVPELGAVEFAVDIPCQGDFRVWGRVFDGDPGVHQFNDPDSYYARVDGGPEIEWFYGCQTEQDPKPWAWHRVRGVDGNSCGDQFEWTLPLAPGTHYFRFRNKEGQNGSVRAAIARILVTNDFALVPP